MIDQAAHQIAELAGVAMQIVNHQGDRGGRACDGRKGLSLGLAVIRRKAVRCQEVRKAYWGGFDPSGRRPAKRSSFNLKRLSNISKKNAFAIAGRGSDHRHGRCDQFPHQSITSQGGPYSQ